MLAERKFSIVKVSKTNGTGMEKVESNNKVVTYDGKKVAVNLF